VAGGGKWRRLKVGLGIVILGVAIGATASVVLVVLGAMPDDSAVAPGPIGPKTRALPNVRGLSLTAAEALVHHPERLHVRKTYSKASRGTVLRQHPRAGTLLTSTDTVILRIAKPFPEVPRVVGISVARAKAHLRNVGYHPRAHFRYSSRAPGTVLQTLPHAGKGLRPSKTVRVYVAKERPVCDPDYTGACVPDVPYDLDCSDIGYQTVYVVGYDKYGFDGYDNDGIGCE
jgi:beta-lactam-binding protein with PASTA domain